VGGINVVVAGFIHDADETVPFRGGVLDHGI
jgi:hypothetical protein